jgi:hypothetical protein
LEIVIAVSYSPFHQQFARAFFVQKRFCIFA